MRNYAETLGKTEYHAPGGDNSNRGGSNGGSRSGARAGMIREQNTARI